MSALRVSYPGQPPRYIDLGPGTAGTGEMHGTMAVPAASCQHAIDEEARRIARAATKRAWREAHRDHLSKYERLRTARRRVAR